MTALFRAGLVLAALVAAGTAQARVEYESGDWEVRLTGRLQVDGLVGASVDSADKDYIDLRRARLGLRVDWRDWGFRVSGDFPDDSLELRDLRLGYYGLPVHLEVGRMQEPFGMAENQSSKHLQLMERPLATILGPDFSTGVRANLRGDRWAATVGAFDGSIRGVELSEQDISDDQTIGGRFTFTPTRSDGLFTHLGAAVSLRYPDGNEGVRFSARPESILIFGRNTSNPRIDSDQFILYGTEFALRNGPRLFQAEYILADVDNEAGPDATFDGYYAQASWVLTGERRGYSTRRGVFTGVSPKNPVTRGGLGAIEIAARYSNLDLRDIDVDADGDIDGEEGTVYSAGVNWHPIDLLSFSLNALRIDVDSGTDRDKETVVQWRAQLDF